MADYEWTGAASTDFDTNGNWRGGTSPAGSLAGGDNITVLSTATNDMLLNIDLTDEDTVGFRAGTFYIQPGCAVNVGADGAPLKCSAAQLVHRGNGKLYFQASEGTTGCGDTTDVVINSPNTALAAVLDDDGAQQIKNIQIAGGAVTLAADMLTVPALSVTAPSGSPISTNVTVNSSANPISELFISGGSVSAARHATITVLTGGTLEYTSSTTYAIIYMGGGRFTHKSSAAITNAYFAGGVAELRSVTAPITITDYYEFPSAKVYKSDDVVTITNEHKFGTDFT